MRASFYYLMPKPWHWAQHCFIGLGCLYEDEGIFDIEIGLFFLVLGIEIRFGGAAD